MTHLPLTLTGDLALEGTQIVNHNSDKYFIHACTQGFRLRCGVLMASSVDFHQVALQGLDIKPNFKNSADQIINMPTNLLERLFNRSGLLAIKHAPFC